MIPRTHEENKFYKKQKVCYIWLKRFSTDDDNKKYHKVRDHCHYIEQLLIVFTMVLHMIIIL